MEDFITAIGAQITSANLWGALTPVVPVLGAGVLFALGVYFTRRVVKGISHGKAKI